MMMNILNQESIVSFLFNKEQQIIEVVKKVASNQIYPTNPPRPKPDYVWKEIYKVVDGKIKMVEKIDGKHEPANFVSERIIF